MNIFNNYIYSANHKYDLWLKWLIYCSWWCTFAANYPGFQIHFLRRTSALREGSSAESQSNNRIFGQRLCVFCHEKSASTSLNWRHQLFHSASCRILPARWFSYKTMDSNSIGMDFLIAPPISYLVILSNCTVDSLLRGMCRVSSPCIYTYVYKIYSFHMTQHD